MYLLNFSVLNKEYPMSMKDLVLAALATPPIIIQGPRIGGITLSDMVTRAKEELELEKEASKEQ